MFFGDRTNDIIFLYGDRTNDIIYLYGDRTNGIISYYYIIVKSVCLCVCLFEAFFD